MKPIVMISSWPPRLCGIATFAEEALEFIEKVDLGRPTHVISHTDGEGENVFPIIDLSRPDWWRIVADKVRELDPYAIHIQHEHSLYERKDARGHGDGNEGFVSLLGAISEFPIVLEPHTVHGRQTEFEANLLYRLCRRSDVMLFKCHYQKWRVEFTFAGRNWDSPRNIMVVPHGARPDRHWSPEQVPALRQDLGIPEPPEVSRHLVGLVGWIQSNKRWDILTSMWAEIVAEIKARTGFVWELLAAGTWRDEAHLGDYEKYKNEVMRLAEDGHASYYEFTPRGEKYYKVMAICDFIVLPSVDETQSGTLARVIALNKPFITTAPMEGLTAQTLESRGGLLFTTKKMLRDNVIRMACDENLRVKLGDNLKQYLEEVVSWEVVAGQYYEAYDLAQQSKKTGNKVQLASEF